MAFRLPKAEEHRSFQVLGPEGAWCQGFRVVWKDGDAQEGLGFRV